MRKFYSALLLVGLLACADQSSTGPSAGQVVVELQGLPTLSGTSGSYRAWLVDGSGNTVPLDVTVTSSFSAALTIPQPTAVEITFEPSAPKAGTPRQVLLRGVFRNGSATLGVEGALTRSGFPLRQRPGQFTMFTPSNNLVSGYPSNEESGVWLFNMSPRETDQNDMWVRLTPLNPGWTYEGWMVRDYGSTTAIWLSYGKFLPDESGAVNRRDDTGWGAFSGVLNFKTDGEEEFPGDDWISNPLSFPWPSELKLPLDLRERNASGQMRWAHVISIEPISDKGEAIGQERPFPLMLYRDPFGDGAPGVARTITFHPEMVPSGTARLR